MGKPKWVSRVGPHGGSVALLSDFSPTQSKFSVYHL